TRSHPSRRASSNELFQQLDPEIDLVFGDLETWREREHILVVPAYVEDQSHALAAGDQVTLHAFNKNSVSQRAIGLKSILSADLDAKRHSHAIGVADHLWIATLQVLDLREEICALSARGVLVVVFGHHAD